MMALFGAISLAVFGGGETRVQAAATEWVVEVNEGGFNPRQCNIVRGDRVAFKNTGKVPIRVYKPVIGGLPPDPDWTLQPGETSPKLGFDFGYDDDFFSEFGDSMTIFTPFTSNGTPGCYKEAPTPTPTATFTATPTATPPPPRPVNCTWVGCAVTIGLASDGD